MEVRFTKGRLFQNTPIIGNIACVKTQYSTYKKHHYKILFLISILCLVSLKKGIFIGYLRDSQELVLQLL